jgi:hypothetical protein
MRIHLSISCLHYKPFPTPYPSSNNTPPAHEDTACSPQHKAGLPLHHRKFPRLTERAYRMMEKPAERIGRVYLRKVGDLVAFGTLCRPVYPSDGLSPREWFAFGNRHQYLKLCSSTGTGVPLPDHALRLYLKALFSQGVIPDIGEFVSSVIVRCAATSKGDIRPDARKRLGGKGATLGWRQGGHRGGAFDRLDGGTAGCLYV